MVEIRLSRPDELPAQKRLWKLAFGDGDQVIDGFYACCRPPEEMLLLLEDGKLKSMLALLPETLALPGGREVSTRYIYALATDPAARGRGYARRLLDRAAARLRERGVDCVTTVPAEPGLHSFFSAAGFGECFAAQVWQTPWGGRPAEGGRAETVGPEAYNAIRDRLLAGMASVRYPDRLIRFQAEICRITGGGLFRLTVDGAEGCAAAEYAENGDVVLKELLLPAGHTQRGLAALGARLPGTRAQVRTPAGAEWADRGATRPFGMLKWLREDPPETAAAYMGLGFD